MQYVRSQTRQQRRALSRVRGEGKSAAASAASSHIGTSYRCKRCGEPKKDGGLHPREGVCTYPAEERAEAGAEAGAARPALEDAVEEERVARGEERAPCFAHPIGRPPSPSGQRGRRAGTNVPGIPWTAAEEAQLS